MRFGQSRTDLHVRSPSDAPPDNCDVGNDQKTLAKPKPLAPPRFLDRELKIKLKSKLNLPRRYDRRLRERGLPGDTAGCIDFTKYARPCPSYVEVIDAVETLRAELQVQPFRDLRVLGDRNVCVERTGPGQAIALDVTQKPRSRFLVA